MALGKYPYLGENYIDEKRYVVLFVEQDKGVVVMNETDNPRIKFGMLGDFAEEAFQLLPPDVCVRLQN